MPSSEKRSVTILGATGTIGQNTLSLISDNPEKFSVKTLIARKNYADLARQARQFNVENAVVEDESEYENLKAALSGTDIKVYSGKKAVEELSSEQVDMFVSGAVGFCALKPTLAAIKAGSTIGLANKECLVCAGELMIDEAKKHSSKLIPVDSEHNSLYQAFDFNNPRSVEKIILTASGGPFREMPIEQLHAITPEMAVNHPNWKMGAKISTDSATMMNKGLEVIEAFYLFPVELEQIEVIVHPESMIHGIVQYTDGSMLAGLSYHDMRIPISLALGLGDRLANKCKRIDLTELSKLTFYKPDNKKFPALKLAYEALSQGSAAPIILNSANEVAVDAFLSNRIKFTQIVDLVTSSIENLSSKFPKNITSLDEVFDIDAATRKYAEQSILKKVA